MKKTLFIICSAIVLTAFLSSCGDKEKDKDNNTPGEKFSTLSVEENKAKVKDAGIKLVSTMNDMENLETVGVVMNLGNILSSIGGEKKSVLSKDSKLFTMLMTFAESAKGEKKINDVYKSMIAPKELSDDPESIQEFWDQNVGTYTWNPSLDDWDTELGGNKIIFLFPSTENGTTNDATLTISDYAGVNIANPVDEDYTGDMPTALNANLKVGSKTLVTVTFAGSYNTDGVPNAVAADLTIETFKYEIDITNNSTVVAVNYKLTNNGTTIMDMGASGNGLFTKENIDANTDTTTYTDTYGYWDYQFNPISGNWEEVWVEYTDTYQETNTDFEEVIHTAEAHFQLFDVALKGEIDVKGLVDQVKLIEDDWDNEVISEDTAYAREARQINKYLNLRLVKTKTNGIMAKAEAYVLKKVSTNYIDKSIDFRLTFGDGSPIDTETYFNEGFSDFINELNSFINNLNSDYDMGIDPVEYGNNK